MCENHSIRCLKGDAVVKSLKTFEVLKDGLCTGQFGARIDAHGFFFITDHDTCAAPRLAGNANDVCEVILATGVIISNSFNQLKQYFCISADHP